MFSRGCEMLFDGMTDEEKALFAGICRVCEYSAGDQMVRAGAQGRSLLIVRTGSAEVRKQLDARNYKNLKVLKEGDFFGEMSFLHGAERSADVVATGRCEMLELTMEDFDKLCRQNPAIGMKIYRNMAVEVADRLRKNNEELKKAILWAME